MSLLLSIPSPGSGAIDLGPLQIHMYGLTLLAAIGICIWITGTRFVNRGGDWDLIFRCAVWGVGAGIVGARLYHLATSWNEVPDAVVGPRARSGRAASGSGAGSPSAVSSAASSRSARGRTCGCSPTASHPACSWRRRSGGSATGGTRSSSARRPTCRGASRSTRPTGRSRRSTRRPYHPAFLYEMLWNLLRRGAARLRDRAALPPAPTRALRALHRALLLRPLLDRVRPGRSGERHPRPARQHLGFRARPASPVSSGSGSRSDGDRPDKPRPAAPPPKGPKMAVPKGRVRPGG